MIILYTILGIAILYLWFTLAWSCIQNSTKKLDGFLHYFFGSLISMLFLIISIVYYVFYSNETHLTIKINEKEYIIESAECKITKNTLTLNE